MGYKDGAESLSFDQKEEIEILISCTYAFFVNAFVHVKRNTSNGMMQGLVRYQSSEGAGPWFS